MFLVALSFTLMGTVTAVMAAPVNSTPHQNIQSHKAKPAVRTPAKAKTQSTQRRPSSKKPVDLKVVEPIRYDLDVTQDGRQIVLRENRSQIQQTYYVELKRRKKTLGIVSLDQKLFKKYAAEMESLSSMKTKGSCSRGIRLKRTQNKNIKTTSFCEADLTRTEQERLKRVTADFMALVGTASAQKDAKR